jgi:hypothetical protein
MIRRFLIACSLAGLIVGGSAGCFISTQQPSSKRQAAKKKDCPPAYHWDGRQCIHNKHKGKGKGKGRR